MFGLSKYVLIALAVLSALGGFTGWRWLKVRETLAVERAQYRQAVDGFNEQLRQVQQNEQISREASRGYQAQLLTVQAAADRLRADNSGLQVIAYRRLAPVTIAPTRFIDPATEPERDSGTVLDLARLERLAAACQADAEQLAALQRWVYETAKMPTHR